MNNASIVDVLIENIKTDQELLATTETKISEAKEEKRAITERLKDYRRDISVLLKYADDSHRKQIEELGFDFSESEQGLNPVAQIALDIILAAKGNQMSNEELYNAYVKTFKKKEDAFNYTEFNIKTRSLFNTQRLLRKKGKDPKTSREDIISVNGRVVETQKDKPKSS
ncbi:MAG: hypothetical protein COW66_13100 [Flavobacteriaceae bacterium CG18_big_fil_WC_8_21_14_2_50_34_36]|nr:hypothetical protein [Flavobacteriia bacterium]NCT18039.1 hypothetical protein [Flavobacteriia bacterium]PIQ17204.1 MAG: hypothetical protein COW66_13100 [Flavobacteriaceae bacterium CG18_big_fil_WC_8_21_14_2_50_34_36]PJC08202.1 MAG: hypothetical protein CO068_02135 [Flavobacteriaceae bacterium CG_4_9_14_0_8_um_filter_34_30]